MTSLRFFADHCVPVSAIDHLADASHVVLRLRDHIRPDSKDPAVIGEAQRQSCVLLSLNGDFCDVINYPPSQYGGIVALQLKDHPEVLPHVLTRLDGLLRTHPMMSDFRGKLFIVEPHRVRVRT